MGSSERRVCGHHRTGIIPEGAGNHSGAQPEITDEEMLESCAAVLLKHGRISGILIDERKPAIEHGVQPSLRHTD
jgi:hypothetical protein